MKKSHKAKGYRLEASISRQSFLEIRKMFGMSESEIKKEKIMMQKVLQEQPNHDDNNSWIKNYNIIQQANLEKYLLQSQISDSSLISSLNRVDRYINSSQRLTINKSKKEDEKVMNQLSQKTEAQLSDKIA